MKQFCLVLLIAAAAQAQFSLNGQLTIQRPGHSGQHGFNFHHLGDSLRNGVNQVQRGIFSFGKQVQQQVSAGVKAIRDRVVRAQIKAVQDSQLLVDAAQAQAKKALNRLAAFLNAQVEAGQENVSAAQARLAEATAQVDAKLNQVRESVNSNGESLLRQLTGHNVVDAKTGQQLLDAVKARAAQEQDKLIDVLNGLNAQVEDLSVQAEIELAQVQADAQGQVSAAIENVSSQVSAQAKAIQLQAEAGLQKSLGLVDQADADISAALNQFSKKLVAQVESGLATEEDAEAQLAAVTQTYGAQLEALRAEINKRGIPQVAQITALAQDLSVEGAKEKMAAISAEALGEQAQLTQLLQGLTAQAQSLAATEQVVATTSGPFNN
ncbi:hypothetical protein HDE_04524 [Halotydeus destructor]|nr:hypothetical protein HDE_04524 [Halotydeus destructor]